jgi:hypothetical protein
MTGRIFLFNLVYLMAAKIEKEVKPKTIKFLGTTIIFLYLDLGLPWFFCPKFFPLKKTRGP